jgi:flagellar motor switch protein FliG
MDGIKKTALLLSGLELNTVDLLLGRLDPDDARAVRREMMSLRSVPETESRRVADEFLEASGVRPKPTSGYYGPPMPKTQQKPMRFPAEAFEPRLRRPFDFLANIDAETIAHEISLEHPQTIAVVLANIPKRRAADILKLLPITLQKNVSRRLAEYEPADEYVVTEIASVLRDRLEDFRCDLSGLEQLNNAELSRLFHSVDIETAVLALVGAKASLIERVVKRFTPTQEHEFRRHLKRLGTIDENDVLSARQTLLAGVRRVDFFTPHPSLSPLPPYASRPTPHACHAKHLPSCSA